METGPDPQNVLYLNEALLRVKNKLTETATFAEKKVLPGARGTILRQLTEANTLLKGIQELVERSGLGKRLGFIQSPKGIQPVILKEDDPGLQEKPQATPVVE